MKLVDANKLREELAVGLPLNVRDLIFTKIDRFPTANAVALPCKVGDTIYFIQNYEVKTGIVKRFFQNSHGEWKMQLADKFSPKLRFAEIGNTIFFSPDKAYKKVNKMFYRAASNNVRKGKLL